MLVYRICHAKWAKQLTASGFPARWNSKGTYIIYTSQYCSLSCLENIVHRGCEGLQDNFRLLTIQIPSAVKIKTIQNKILSENWNEYSNQYITQAIGDTWVQKNITPVLKIPSAIIHGEFNFLLNINHQGYKKIKLQQIERLVFDARIKDN